MQIFQPILNVMIVLLLGSTTGFAVEIVKTNEIRVEVTGIKHLTGTLRARLDLGERAFKNDEPPHSTVELPVSAESMILVFKDVPPGTYAIKIIHDENDDGKLNRNILGIPSEPYGISNNARAKFGLPSIDEASFAVKDQNVDLKVNLSTHSMF